MAFSGKISPKRTIKLLDPHVIAIERPSERVLTQSPHSISPATIFDSRDQFTLKCARLLTERANAMAEPNLIERGAVSDSILSEAGKQQYFRGERNLLTFLVALRPRRRWTRAEIQIQTNLYANFVAFMALYHQRVELKREYHQRCWQAGVNISDDLGAMH